LVDFISFSKFTINVLSSLSLIIIHCYRKCKSGSLVGEIKLTEGKPFCKLLVLEMIYWFLKEKKEVLVH